MPFDSETILLLAEDEDSTGLPVQAFVSATMTWINIPMSTQTKKRKEKVREIEIFFATFICENKLGDWNIQKRLVG